jgi:hypothetical protein
VELDHPVLWELLAVLDWLEPPDLQVQVVSLEQLDLRDLQDLLV